MKKLHIKNYKVKRVRAYADIGSHNGIFMFDVGYVGIAYPTLLHIYRKKVTKDLRPVIIEYKIK
jgi:hypothetical protein